MSIETFNEVLKKGPYAWPGGYPIFFVTRDGDFLSFKAAEQNSALIREAIANPGTDKQWEVVAFDINWESEIYCSHTNEKIERAYELHI